MGVASSSLIKPLYPNVRSIQRFPNWGARVLSRGCMGCMRVALSKTPPRIADLVKTQDQEAH